MNSLLAAAGAAVVLAIAAPAGACCIGPPLAKGQASALSALDADPGAAVAAAAQTFSSQLDQAVAQNRISSNDAQPARTALANLQADVDRRRAANNGVLSSADAADFLQQISSFTSRIWVRAGYF